jgi:hypothetical protein
MQFGRPYAGRPYPFFKDCSVKLIASRTARNYVFMENEQRLATESAPDTAPEASAPGPSFSPTDKLEEYRQKVAATNIDTRSLLSTDYFNTFNSIVMVLDMLPEAPELLEEVENWQFLNYTEHFTASGLDFAELAIEAYAYAPIDTRKAFECKIHGMKIILEENAHILRHLLDIGETQAFAGVARGVALQLRAMMEEGNGIVHGSRTIAQSEIDKLF